jgi:hypothetical protein
MVLRGLIATYLPPVDALMQEHDIELSLITLNWFLTLYSSVLHIKLLLRCFSRFMEICFSCTINNFQSKSTLKILKQLKQQRSYE